ncbi:MAG: hypothetical protein IKJ57_03650 [Oscillospiraceae bacterium]|nr:hypothetical protein [Oscillospiraceae bacterium]
MMLSMAIPAFSAETEEITATIEGVSFANPMYNYVTEVVYDDHIVPDLLNSSEYVGVDEAVLKLREAMKARAESFYIYLETTDEINYTVKNGALSIDQNELNDFFKGMLLSAVSHSGVPNEGDYLFFHYSNYAAGGSPAEGKEMISISTMGNKLRWRIPFYMTYNSTAEMEEAVDEKVESLVESLGLENKTTYQKIESIYDYLCKNVVYASDAEMADGDSYEHSAYAALIEGEAVCQGYALAFYRLALEAGVDTRCIAGLGNGGPHAWNIAKIGKYYYNLDATWDAPRKEIELDYLYFLRNMENFEDHQRYGPEGKEVGHMDYTTAAFNAAYPMSASDYSLSGISIIGDEGIANGYANVSVEITDGTEAAMIQFTLDFDPSELQVESCTAGAAMENLDPSINFDNEEGKIYFAWDAIESITKGGSVLDIVFKISEDAKVDDKLNIDFADKDEEDLIVGTFIGKDQNGKPQYSEINTDFSGGKVTVVDRVAADITGTVIMWNDSNDVSYLVYPADTTDADIKADAKLADPKKDIGAKVVKGTPTSYGTKQYSQSFTIEDVEEGEYKVVIFKPGKYVVKILPVEITGSEVNFGEQKMWLKGDVNYTGVVDYGDLQRLYQHIATNNKMTGDALLVANINEVGVIDYGDLQRLYQHIATSNKFSD